MYCKYLSKALNGNLRCKLTKTIIDIAECKKCGRNKPRMNKPINKKTNKLKQKEQNRKNHFRIYIREEVRIDKLSVMVYNVTQQTSEL